MVPELLKKILTGITLFLVLPPNAYPHEVDARGSQTLGWQSEDVWGAIFNLAHLKSAKTLSQIFCAKNTAYFIRFWLHSIRDNLSHFCHSANVIQRDVSLSNVIKKHLM